MKMNKRGQDLSLTTIILIIIGVAVLVLLIWGFSQGWSTLWSKIVPYSGNEDTIRSSCNSACLTNDKGGFCTQTRTVKTNDGYTNSVGITCDKMSTGTVEVKKGDDIKQVNIGVSTCPNLCTA